MSSLHCARWGVGTQLPSPKRGRAPQVFGPSLLWPNSWMHQDATWYGGRTRPTRHCVRCGPSYRRKRAHPPHPIFGPCLLWPQSPISATAELLFTLSWHQLFQAYWTTSALKTHLAYILTYCNIVPLNSISTSQMLPAIHPVRPQGWHSDGVKCCLSVHTNEFGHSTAYLSQTM